MNKQNPYTDDALVAMEAIFAFATAMDRGITTNDLADIMLFSVKHGWEKLQIMLSMALLAAEIAQSRSQTVEDGQ